MQQPDTNVWKELLEKRQGYLFAAPVLARILDWRRRHQVGKSVRLAPEGELDHLLPDMAADHRWKHVSGGSNANGNDAMRVLQVALACVAVLSVLVMIGYGLGVRGS